LQFILVLDLCQKSKINRSHFPHINWVKSYCIGVMLSYILQATLTSLRS